KTKSGRELSSRCYRKILRDPDTGAFDSLNPNLAFIRGIGADALSIATLWWATLNVFHSDRGCLRITLRHIVRVDLRELIGSILCIPARQVDQSYASSSLGLRVFVPGGVISAAPPRLSHLGGDFFVGILLNEDAGVELTDRSFVILLIRGAKFIAEIR